jgi:hypothetical protein
VLCFIFLRVFCGLLRLCGSYGRVF